MAPCTAGSPSTCSSRNRAPTERCAQRGGTREDGLITILRLAAAGACLGALAAGAAIAAEPAAAGCLPDGSGFLTARIRGDLDVDLDWHGSALECTGMPRPDGRGMRLRFAGALPDGSRLAVVFAPPVLAEGAAARAVPVNVTVLPAAQGRIYATRGEQRCLLDTVRQQRLPDPRPGRRAWAVSASGFCTSPARALVGSGDLLLTRFDFRGLVTFDAEEKESKP